MPVEHTLEMSTKIEFTINQKTAFDAKWLGLELHEALDETRLINYWNEMIEDSELIPVDNCKSSYSRKGLITLVLVKCICLIKKKCFFFNRNVRAILYWSLGCELPL